MTKLEKIEKDLGKARDRLAEAQAKVKELEGQYTDEENAMIVQIVRKMKMAPDELAAFLNKNKPNMNDPGKRPSPLGGGDQHKPDGPKPPEPGGNHQPS